MFPFIAIAISVALAIFGVVPPIASIAFIVGVAIGYHDAIEQQRPIIDRLRSNICTLLKKINTLQEDNDTKKNHIDHLLNKIAELQDSK